MPKLKDFSYEWEHRTTDYGSIKAKDEQDAMRRFKKRFFFTADDEISFHDESRSMKKRRLRR